MSWSGQAGLRSALEARAGAFAAGFLAPGLQVRRWAAQKWGRSSRTADQVARGVAREWGLSPASAIWHAHNCGLVSATQARRLEREGIRVSERWHGQFEGARSCEERAGGTTGGEASELVRGAGERLIVAAREAGIISSGRAVEMLTWPSRPGRSGERSPRATVGA